MSEVELNEPDAEEPVVTEPPRIPPRIWHWFVWMLATAVLLSLTRGQETQAPAGWGWIEVLQRIVWSAQSGLAVTACVALWRIIRNPALPREVRWAPGHFLIGLGLVVMLSMIAYYFVIQIIPLSSGYGWILSAINLATLTASCVLGVIGLRLASTRRWRHFFFGWIAILVLEGVGLFVSQLFASVTSLYILSLVTDLICFALMGRAAAGDLSRHPRHLFPYLDSLGRDCCPMLDVVASSDLACRCVDILTVAIGSARSATAFHR